jgi:hypothetical protein
MGFACWIDAETGLAWAQGTHEYRPMGMRGDRIDRPVPASRFPGFPASTRPSAPRSFVGFFGSLEEVNVRLRAQAPWKRRRHSGSLCFINGARYTLSFHAKRTQYRISPIWGTWRCFTPKPERAALLRRRHGDDREAAGKATRLSRAWDDYERHHAEAHGCQTAWNGAHGTSAPAASTRSSGAWSKL